MSACICGLCNTIVTLCTPIHEMYVVGTLRLVLGRKGPPLHLQTIKQSTAIVNHG